MEDVRNMKFTKVAALILSLSVAGMSVAACSNEPEPVSSDINIISTQSQSSMVATAPSAYVDPNAESENFVFTYSGYNFVVNTVLDESQLPDDYDVFQQASCAGQGLASHYEFKGGSFWVELYPGADSIYTIQILDDTVTTAEGVYIGNTLDQVKAAYGEPSISSEAVVVYEKGSSQLWFGLDENNVVNQIMYFGI